MQYTKMEIRLFTIMYFLIYLNHLFFELQVIMIETLQTL